MIAEKDYSLYLDTISTLSNNASAFTHEAISDYISRNASTLSVAGIREYSTDILSTSRDIYGRAGAAASIEFFEANTSKAGLIQVRGDIPEIEKVAHYQATKLVDPLTGSLTLDDIDSYLMQVSNYSRDSVRRLADDTQVSSSAQPKTKNVKYARVLNDVHPCAFCTMLAGRGFVYHSAQNAGLGRDGLNHYHRGCKCLVIADTDSDPGIQGYDIEGVQRDYEQIVKEAHLTDEVLWDMWNDLTEEEKRAWREKCLKEEKDWWEAFKLREYLHAVSHSLPNS